MVKYENNYTLSSHGRCDFLIAPFAECIKNYIFYHKLKELRKERGKATQERREELGNTERGGRFKR